MTTGTHSASATLAILLSLVAGCSESNSSPPDAGQRDAAMEIDDAAQADGGSAAVDAATALTDGGPADGAVPTVAALVINEIRPSDDFAEIYNPTSNPISLTSYAFADLDGIGPDPADPAHVTPFAADITLEPGEHLVVAMNAGDESTDGTLSLDPAGDCYGAPRCVLISYGIGSGSPDAAAIVDVATAEAHTRGDWPGAAAAMLADGQTWCRFPDGTGDFTRCVASPGAVNALP